MDTGLPFQSDSVRDYEKILASTLDGKDPRVAQAVPSSALFLFVGEGTLTVQIHAIRVVVVNGSHTLPNLPTVLVRTTLAEWLLYCESGGPQSGVEVFGDVDVLGGLARLTDYERSALSARFFRGG